MKMRINRSGILLRPMVKMMTNISTAWAMERKNMIGFAFCVTLFSSGFLIHGNVGLYFNLAGLLIVVGGTLGATLICFRTKRLLIVHKVLMTSYRTRVKEPDEIVQILVDLSVKSRLKGILSLQEDENETSILFLRRALGFLVDAYPSQQIKDFLNTEMYYFKVRREESERVLRTMAEICPAFGMVGSVVGLISMLTGVGDSAVILATVPIALTSTLYGVVLANFFFLPFAASIRQRTNRELLLQKIITDAVLAIESEVNPRVLEMKLKSFLTPSSRQGRLVSLERIQKKFQIKPQPKEPSPAQHLSVQHS
jgi:chemotaxis protein MotA